MEKLIYNLNVEHIFRSITNERKKREISNRASLLYRIKKINKIIRVIYKQNDRKSNSYIAEKLRNCFNKDDI